MEERVKTINVVTVLGGVANALLMLFKFVAGFLAGSAAMISDAVHSLSDFLTDIVVLVFVNISHKPQDKDHDYGHGKFETLASMLIGIMLLGVALGIIWSGGSKIYRWIQGENLCAPGMLAFWAAIASILVKEATYQYTIHYARKLDSPALKANAWHHRSDALSSIGTAIGIAGAIFLSERWTVLDPVASVIVGCLIVKVSFDLIKEGVAELTDRSLSDNLEEEIISIASSVPDVVQPHDLRTRRMGSDYAIEMHIYIDGRLPLSEAHDRTDEIETLLKRRFGENTHVAIHVEPSNQAT